VNLCLSGLSVAWFAFSKDADRRVISLFAELFSLACQRIGGMTRSGLRADVSIRALAGVKRSDKRRYVSGEERETPALMCVTFGAFLLY